MHLGTIIGSTERIFFTSILKCTNLYVKSLELVNKQKTEPGNDSEYHFLVPSLSTGQ